MFSGAVFVQVYAGCGRCLREGLPVTYPAGVDMDKIGSGIIADPAPFHGGSGFAEVGQGVSSKSNVDGLSGHMQALCRYALGMRLQLPIGGGGAITGDDFKRGVHGDPVMQFMEKVQQVGVNGFDFPRSMISEQMVDLL